MVLELCFIGKKLLYNYPLTIDSVILLWALIKWRVTAKIFLKGFLICALISTGQFLFMYSTYEVPPYLQLSWNWKGEYCLEALAIQKEVKEKPAPVVLWGQEGGRRETGSSFTYPLFICILPFHQSRLSSESKRAFEMLRLHVSKHNMRVGSRLLKFILYQYVLWEQVLGCRWRSLKR